jgi:hypothetical protein
MAGSISEVTEKLEDGNPDEAAAAVRHCVSGILAPAVSTGCQPEAGRATIDIKAKNNLTNITAVFYHY